MMKRRISSRLQIPRLPLLLLITLIGILWVAGGASRADVPAQTVTRLFTWLVFLVGLFTLDRPDLRRIKMPAAFVFAATVLVGAHLVPLPPDLWSSLPGRSAFIDAAKIADAVQPWRPLSISPGGTVNALASLIVPITVLLSLAMLKTEEMTISATALLIVVGISASWGLFQFAGVSADHPLLNDRPGAVSGPFANRNHLALFCAIGCVLAPTWALERTYQKPWHLALALSLILLFLLVIFATGSRAGAAVGLVGAVAGIAMARKQLIKQLRRMPRNLAIALVGASSTVVIGIIALSVFLGRAVSISRLTDIDAGQELRLKALPVLLDMVNSYFPLGSGFGTFDPAFRIDEPDALLSVLYLNHAHNDFVELAIDGGLPALLLLAGAITWWLMRGYKVMFSDDIKPNNLARAGFFIILLTMASSLFDYPARTPMIMACITISAVWLSQDRWRLDSPSNTEYR